MSVFSKPSVPPLQQAAPTPSRLNSWKEIASYFDRDVRTVQLWEKREGLPVHRHEHGSRSSVYARPSELDFWFSHRSRNIPAVPLLPLDALPVSSSIDPLEPIRKHGLLPQSRPARLWLGLAVLGVACVATTAAFRLHPAVRGMEPAPGPVTAAPPSVIAVLPFQDISAPAQDNLWSDGVTDDLITELGRNGSLQVISRRSSMKFRNTHESPASIASQLHASLLLEGTVAHTKDEIRITAQLVDPAHDRELWSERYIHKTGGVLSIQDEVASSIAATVAGKITGKPVPVDLARSPLPVVDPQARVEYLTGKFFFDRRDEPSILQAVDHFQRAIARQANYAAAYAGLADCFNLLSTWGHFTSAQGFPRSREATLTALRLDPASAEAYTALAFETFRYEWNVPQAETYFHKAIELNPNYAPAHHWYGQYLVDLRRFDAGLGELRKAHDLDPLSAIIASDLADGYIYARQYAPAVSLLKQTLQFYPSFVPAQSYLVSAYADSGDLQAAGLQAEAYRQLSHDDGPLLLVRLKLQLLQGNLDEARRQAVPLLEEKKALPVGTADIYFDLGEKEKGYAALDQAVRQHDWWLITLLDDPSFDSVRDEPRFLAIERRVGLPVSDNTATRQ